MSNKTVGLSKYSKYIVTTIIFLTTTYIYASPYLAILRIKAIINENEIYNIGKHIDFPSIRNDLKYQLNQHLETKLYQEKKIYPFVSLGMILFNPIINKIIEGTVNPKGLNILLNTGKLTSSINNKAINKSNTVSSNKERKVNNIKLSYEGLNIFVIEKTFSSPNHTIKAYLKRDMITNWKLNKIQLPYNILDHL